MKHREPSAPDPSRTMVGKVPSGQGDRLAYRHFGSSREFADAYHNLLRASWPRVLATLFALYLTANAAFALLYMLGGDCLGLGRAPSFFQAFAFSVQTMSSIGYGAMSPTTSYADFMVVIEAFAGLTGMAMGTGLMFAKFSRPTARIVFANHPIILTFDGMPTLQIRVANQRTSQIVEASAHMTVLRDHITQEGQHLRKIIELDLVRQHSAVFGLSWTLMHVIDEASPLYGVTADTLEEMLLGLYVTISGTDDLFAATVHAQRGYTPADFRFDQRYADMILLDEDERTLVIDHTRIHLLEPVDTGAQRLAGSDPAA